MVDGTVYQPGATIYLTDNAVAYAQWTAGDQTPENPDPCTIRDMAVSDSGVTVWIENRNAEDARIWAAAYTAEERLLAIASQSLTIAPSQSGGVSVPLVTSGAASVRAIALDRNFRPLCASVQKNLS